MKKFILILLPILALAGCQSKTYYGAQSTNLQRFDGWQEENATFLMEANDLTLLLQNLSTLAMTEANRRDTYLTAEEAYPEFQNLLLDFKIEAAARRVKLSSVLSKDNDLIYQQLRTAQKDDFDSLYQKIMLQKIAELQSISEDYTLKGHNEGLKDFSEKIIHTLSPLNEKIKALEMT